MDSGIKKAIKILIISVISILIAIVGVYVFAFICMFGFDTYYNYVYYVDESEYELKHYFINTKNEKKIYSLYYLQECSSIGSGGIPKEIGGLVYTEILIMGQIPEIKIKDCRVEIRDTKNQVIPYRSVVIQDRAYYHSEKEFNNEFQRYNNIDEYLKTERIIDIHHTNYAIYYTYLHKNLKDVNEATLNIKFKYEIKGKTYEQKIKKKIYRRVKKITIEYKWAVPDIVEE